MAAIIREAIKIDREANIQRAILELLVVHPRVAWAKRINSGVASMGGRRVAFGFPGCPDIIGQLKDGRFLGIEVKAPGKAASKHQAAFIARSIANGGACGVAHSVTEAMQIIGG